MWCKCGPKVKYQIKLIYLEMLTFQNNLCTSIKMQTSYISILYICFGLCWHQTPKRGPSGPLRWTVRGTKVTLGQEHCKNTSLHYGPSDREASTVRDQARTVRPQARTVRSVKTRKTRR
jgi:hypothetical protein